MSRSILHIAVLVSVGVSGLVRAGVAETYGAGGATVGERGAGLAGAFESQNGALLLAVRAEYGAGLGEMGDAAGLEGFEGTALFGLGPALGPASVNAATVWDERCVAKVAAVEREDGCWLSATALISRDPPVRISRRWALLGGARAGTGGFSDTVRLSGVVSGRWHLGGASRSFGRQFVEFGVAKVVAGRDRPHLKHTPLVPGWYARVQLQRGLLFTAEVGVTGLAYRDRQGGLLPELYGRVSVMLAWGT